MLALFLTVKPVHVAPAAAVRELLARHGLQVVEPLGEIATTWSDKLGEGALVCKQNTETEV